MSADERMAQAYALEQMKERAGRAEGERNQALGDLKAEVVANRIARSELEAARDEDQEACRVVMAERDEWRAKCERSEAVCAKIRDALLILRDGPEITSYEDAARLRALIDAALATDCGAALLAERDALLERVRGAEIQRDHFKETSGRCASLRTKILFACQSLSRKWREQRDDHRVCCTEGNRERASLRAEVERLKVALSEHQTIEASDRAKVAALEGAGRNMAVCLDRYREEHDEDARDGDPVPARCSCARCQKAEHYSEEFRALLPAPRKESCPACGRELEPGTGCACDWPLNAPRKEDEKCAPHICPECGGSGRSGMGMADQCGACRGAGELDTDTDTDTDAALADGGKEGK